MLCLIFQLYNCNRKKLLIFGHTVKRLIWKSAKLSRSAKHTFGWDKNIGQFFDLCAKMSQTTGNCCEKAIDLDPTRR